MWLVNSTTIRLEQFSDTSIPPYVILSHTWTDGEVSFQDMQDSTYAVGKPGYSKVSSTCEKARDSGYGYAWIDTCCIDKRSSAELQEAINSMYRWYAEAEECYAYLADLRGIYAQPETWADFSEDWRPHVSSGMRDNVAKCNWFSRGWTLQELIAPKNVKFYSAGWVYVGSKAEHLDLLASITGVDVGILDHSEELSSVSVATRMSWAANRKTTRLEDQAYALLGIFEVNMPMLYGEGRNAFRRLQEQIMQTSTDHSIFAWQSKSCHRGCLLAGSPADFRDSRSIVSWGRAESFAMTNKGLRLMVPVIEQKYLEAAESLAILNCRYESDMASCLALRLRSYSVVNEYYVRRDVGGSCPHSDGSSRRLAVIGADDAQQLAPQTINIARAFATESPRRKFFLRLPDDAGAKIEVLNVYPKEQWSRDNRIMRTKLSNPRPRGCALLRLPSGAEFILTFGCDFDVTADLPDGIQDKVDIPGLAVRYPQQQTSINSTALYGLDAYCSYEYCTQHAQARRCNHRKTGACPTTPTSARIGEPPDDTEIAWVSIEEQQSMDERMFVITVNAAQTFQLDADDRFVDSLPPELVTAGKSAPQPSGTPPALLRPYQRLRMSQNPVESATSPAQTSR